MTGNVARAVRVQRKLVHLGIITTEFWIVLPARSVGKGARTQIGPAHLSRGLAVEWAKRNGYLVLGGQR